MSAIHLSRILRITRRSPQVIYCLAVGYKMNRILLTKEALTAAVDSRGALHTTVFTPQLFGNHISNLTLPLSVLALYHCGMKKCFYYRIILWIISVDTD